MPNQTLTVGPSEAEDNVLRIFDVTDLRTGTVRDSGKVYVTKTLRGAEVRYALLRAGAVTTVETAHEGGSSVEMKDVEKLATGKILANGSLFVGTEYADEDVTVAVKVLDEDVVEEEPSEKPENAEESPQKGRS